MRSHVGNGGGLLGCVCRRLGCRNGRLPSCRTGLSASLSDRNADIEFTRSKGASLLDRCPYPDVAGHCVLVDRENVFGAVGSPRRNDAAILNTQRLRRACHSFSVGPRRSVVADEVGNSTGQNVGEGRSRGAFTDDHHTWCAHVPAGGTYRGT